MVRVVLLNLILFLLPFAIYAAVVLLTRPGANKDNVWRDAPIFALIAAGIGLIVSVMVFFVSFGDGAKDGTYRPAEYRDGKLVPGRIERE